MEFGPVPPARDEDEVRTRHDANRASWNEGARHYTDAIDEDAAFLRDGGVALHRVEREELGDLRRWCDRAIHLQCASGRDTLGLLNAGAGEVVGIDISDVHIANAEQLSARSGRPARWIRADVLDAPRDLDGTADLVYTGRGALTWLHDLDAWARVVARLLAPGGRLYVFEEHPVTWLFEARDATLAWSGFDYFGHAERSRGWPEQYIGDVGIAPEEQTEKHERLWTLGATFSALGSAGLAVTAFAEHPESFWDPFPAVPEALERRLPLTFSLTARKKPTTGAP